MNEDINTKGPAKPLQQGILPHEKLRELRYFPKLVMGMLSVLIGVVVLSSCSSAELAVETPYVEPAWMAQYREDTEIALASVESCLNALGLEANYSAEGNAIIPQQTQTTPEMDAAIESCYAAPEAVILTNQNYDVEQEYDRMVDTWACLSKQGYQLSAVPTKEAWVDSVKSKGSFYQPYGEINALYNSESNLTASEQAQELGELQNKCPGSALGGGIVTFTVK